MNPRSVCLSIVLLASTPVLTATPPQAPRVSLKPGSFEVSGIPTAVEEGRFVVPTNRTGGSTATLTLGFVRFRSTAERPGSPIVFLAGGPGDAGTRALRGMPQAYLTELRSIADVIAFDQRGTGTSEPANVMCAPTPDQPRDRPSDPGERLTILRRHVEACLADPARAGLDVKGLTSAESADDLEDLRQALGSAKLTLLAGSYGTHLALAAARRHPASIDRMALAGVEGLDDTFKLPSRVDAVLRRIARARRPSLFEDVRTVRARLAAAPVRFTFPTGQVIVLGEWDFQRWVADSLDAVQKIEAMVAALPALLGGDFSGMARWAAGLRMPRPLNLMNLAMNCASYTSPERLARIRSEAQSALLGDVIDFPLPGLCDVSGLPRLPEDFRAPGTLQVPALLIAGGLDGRTPIENVEAVRRGLPRGQVLIVEHGSHGLFREPEVLAGILAFFREPLGGR